MTYQTQIGALRDAAEAAESAGEQVTAVGLADAIDDAATGVPGGRSVAALGALGKAWTDEIAWWVGQAAGYAKALRSAADNYETHEDAAARDLSAYR
ncbi:type VII secretion target [Actinopolymorpha sp. B11F2]|uniref:type VII secretion target n=1 Tax=Actinopolymorpha sp. B11F2 TaxID=3160862 RepID=UPI0032E4C159